MDAYLDIKKLTCDEHFIMIIDKKILEKSHYLYKR